MVLLQKAKLWSHAAKQPYSEVILYLCLGFLLVRKISVK